MKLVWFEIETYKRFRNPTKLNLDGKLIAIVGPNEAGKTSLLNAVSHLNHATPFVASGGSQEISRGTSINENPRIAEWTFALDEHDRKSLKKIDGSEKINWYVTGKHLDGTWSNSISPSVKLDLKARRRLKNITDRISAPYTTVTDQNLISALVEAASSSEGVLSESELSRILTLAVKLQKDDTLRHKRLGRMAMAIYQIEKKLLSQAQIIKTLAEREPQILTFTDGDRYLESEYNINDFFLEEKPQNAAKRKNIPVALMNLTRAAGLDLEKLHLAKSRDDRGLVRTMLHESSEKISDLLRKAWNQSELSLSLDLDGWRFQILLKSKHGQFVRIVERSEGLRQFLTLLVFIQGQQVNKPNIIILIDEAERHLHYDAQADLIQMLAEQKLAEKIIYSTHSAGCLPEDLGSGVRMVVPEDPNSIVENWFWNSGRPGFSPLLFGMGASTLAFFPMRYSVVAEGAADMILLPALLKSALGLDTLGYQIVPGLSVASVQEIGILDNESARTTYLCDNDEAGGALRKKLREAKVPDTRVLNLGRHCEQIEVVEDLVSLTAYVHAANIEIERSGCDVRINAEDLCFANRPGRLIEWCKNHNVQCPSKRAVAYHLVEHKNEFDLADLDQKKHLVDLDLRIREALKMQ